TTHLHSCPTRRSSDLGGAKSPFWRQMFADVFNRNMIKTNVDQNAASLGAAALAAYGLDLWKDYTAIDRAHELQSIEKPDKARARSEEHTSELQSRENL